MNKLLIWLLLLFIASSQELTSSMLSFMETRDQNTIDREMTSFLNIQRNYTMQATPALKAQFIGTILSQDTISIEEKIANVENLRKIIVSEISLYSGWLWNDAAHQVQIDWLQDKLDAIDRELKNLRWKASSFGYKMTVQAATITSYYFMAVLLAYLSQYQYAQLTGDQTEYSFGQLAAMPITKIIELATSATLGTIKAATSPTTKNFLSSIYTGIIAAGATGYDYLAEAADKIGATAPTAAKKGMHDIAQLIARQTGSKSDAATQTDAQNNLVASSAFEKTKNFPWTSSALTQGPNSVKNFSTKNDTSSSWMPSWITNPITQATNYVEDKHKIAKIFESAKSDNKMIDQQAQMAIAQAKAEAIAAQKSDDPRYNQSLNLKLQAITTTATQQKALKDLAAFNAAQQIEKKRST